MAKGKTRFRVAILPGDGIGPEIMNIAWMIAQGVARKYGFDVTFEHGDVGWTAYDRHGDTMPDETWEICKNADAVLLGAVGLPERDRTVERSMRPEPRALLGMRQRFKLGINVRPVMVHPSLAQLSPLKTERIRDGIRMTFIRELTGGDYFGTKREGKNGDWASDECRYTRGQIKAVARAAFRTAEASGDKVTSVDKANVLGATGTFWRRIVTELHEQEFPSVELEHVYVDAFNYYMLTEPTPFRIVLCSNAHGDILSDGAGGLAGSLGLLPSASIKARSHFGLYEPVHGSAPDIAGQEIANPIGMILSVAQMFRYTFRCEEAAGEIEHHVGSVLEQGLRTPDIATGADHESVLSTDQIARKIALAMFRDI